MPSPTASSTPRSSGATNLPLTRAISSSGRSTRRAAISSGRSARSSLMRRRRASSTPSSRATGSKRGGDTNSLQGESLVKLNEALADATARRVAAEGAYRQALATGPTAEVTQSTPGASAAARAASGRVSAEAHVHEAGPSGDGQPSLADRRAPAADRQGAGAGLVGPEQQPACRLSRRALGGKRAEGAGAAAKGRRPEPARAQHPVHDPAARGGHQPRAL